MSDYGERHYLRTMMMVRRGRISIVDDSGAIQKLQLTTSGLDGRDNLERMVEYGLASNPPEGSDAFIVNIGGDPSNGAAVGTNHQATRPTSLGPGETMLYNGLVGVQVYLSEGGLVVNAGGLPVAVNNATTVTITAATEVVMDTPLLKVKGDILDNYETNTVTAKQQRADYDSHGHPVVEVQSGLSTIISGPPTVIE